MTTLARGKSFNLHFPVWSVDECILSHFLKEDLPRIQYANPKIDIQVNKPLKTKDETWQPELVLDFCSSSLTSTTMDKGLQIRPLS
jgi:Mitochondrial ribosomal protein L51 / S25 / CI-B8 domain